MRRLIAKHEVNESFEDQIVCPFKMLKKRAPSKNFSKLHKCHSLQTARGEQVGEGRKFDDFSILNLKQAWKMRHEINCLGVDNCLHLKLQNESSEWTKSHLSVLSNTLAGFEFISSWQFDHDIQVGQRPWTIKKRD